MCINTIYVPGLGLRESVPVRERCAKGLPQVLTVRAHTPGVKAKVTMGGSYLG